MHAIHLQLRVINGSHPSCKPPSNTELWLVGAAQKYPLRVRTARSSSTAGWRICGMQQLTGTTAASHATCGSHARTHARKMRSHIEYVLHETPPPQRHRSDFISISTGFSRRPKRVVLQHRAHLVAIIVYCSGTTQKKNMQRARAFLHGHAQRHAHARLNVRLHARQRMLFIFMLYWQQFRIMFCSNGRECARAGAISRVAAIR